MQRTLEDEDHYENTSFDFDLNVSPEPANGNLLGENARMNYCNKSAKTSSAMSAQRFEPVQGETSTDEASTERHDCDFRSQECQNTQEAEFTSADASVKGGGFGSDIDGIGTAPVLEEDIVGTERVLETESPGVDVDRTMDLNKGMTLAGETMCSDGEGCAGKMDEQAKMVDREAYCHSQTNQTCDAVDAIEDTEAGGTVRTDDLLASEVAGSWASSTDPSIHGENETQRSSKGDEEEGGGALHDSNSPVTGSQSTLFKPVATRWNSEHQTLSEMIRIVAPESKQFFPSTKDRPEGEENIASGSETENCSDNDDDAHDNNETNAEEARVSDSETQGVDVIEPKLDDPMDEDDEETQEDSVG